MRPWEVPYSTRFANRKPRVCIGFLAFGDIAAEVLESAMFWAFYNGRTYADQFEVHFAMATRREQYRARNALVQEAQKVNADFILMLDDDHTLMDCPDLLKHFYEEEKPFQGGLYVQRRKDKIQPVIQKWNRETGICDWVNMEDLPPFPGGPVDVLGGGVNWIDMSVFDFLADPFWWPYPSNERVVWFKPHPMYGLDLHLSMRIQEQCKIQPWLNRKVVLGHVTSEREIVRPAESPGHQLCTACDGVLSWYDGSWHCNICEKVQLQQKMPAVPMTVSSFAHREKFRPAYEKLADGLCAHFKFANCLDVGSGQGFLVDALDKRGKLILGWEKEFESAQPFMSQTARWNTECGNALTLPEDNFDLVTCVEVAEHLPPEDADKLVDALIRSANRQIFFTADEFDTTNPHHVNCQPQSYWIKKFEDRGWHYDAPRTAFLVEDIRHEAAPWLARNAMVFVRGE